MKTHPGSCLCRQVTFEIIGDFSGFFLCHCTRCQKETGSAHAANLFSKTAELNWLSGQDGVKTFRLPDTRFVRSFCNNCGSALPAIGTSGRVVVPAGCLDGDPGVRPNAHIFVGSKAAWDSELELVAKFDELPT